MERNDGYFARAAVTEALARRDEIVPELLRILEAVADDPQRYAKEPDHMALTYAMFLLAQFRETRACPLLVRIFSAPGETAFDLVGETVTEDLCSILASVSGGDLNGMRGMPLDWGIQGNTAPRNKQHGTRRVQDRPPELIHGRVPLPGEPDRCPNQ
jgi:hypothetical protein